MAASSTSSRLATVLLLTPKADAAVRVDLTTAGQQHLQIVPAKLLHHVP